MDPKTEPRTPSRIDRYAYGIRCIPPTDAEIARVTKECERKLLSWEEARAKRQGLTWQEAKARIYARPQWRPAKGVYRLGGQNVTCRRSKTKRAIHFEVVCRIYLEIPVTIPGFGSTTSTECYVWGPTWEKALQRFAIKKVEEKARAKG